MGISISDPIGAAALLEFASKCGISLLREDQRRTEKLRRRLADLDRRWIQAQKMHDLDATFGSLQTGCDINDLIYAQFGCMSRSDAAHALAAYLAHDSAPVILADWPEDLAQFSMLLLTGPGRMVAMPPFTLQMLDLSGFSTAANSEVPHNALHDARALRDHVINHLE